MTLALSGNVTLWVTVNVKIREPERLPSDAVTVTEYTPTLVGVSVPEIRPVTGLIVRPAGKLVALSVRLSPSASVAVTGTDTAVVSRAV